MRVWPASNTFRLQLCFSCRPREAAEPDKWCCDWLQDEVHWLMIPLSGADQSVETMTLKGHTWNVNEHYMKILLWTSRKISTLKIPSEGGPSTFPTSGACPHLSHNPVLLPRCLTFTFLSPKLQGLLCLCNLFPDPMSHWFTFLTSVIFYKTFSYSLSSLWILSWPEHKYWGCWTKVWSGSTGAILPSIYWL